MKRVITLSYIFCTIFGFIQIGKAQSWIQKNATGSNQTTGDPSTARYGGICFVIGDKVYIGSGLNLSSGLGYLQDFWEYDPTTNNWTRKADIPVKRQQAVSFNIGNKGYFGTGFDGNLVKKDFWEYNPSTDTWTQKADFSGNPRRQAIGFSISNKGYLGTGEDGMPMKDFWEYDPLIDVWLQKADFNGGTRKFAVGFSINNKGYIGCGYSSINNIQKDFWEYDPTNNSWIQKTDYGGGPTYASVGFNVGNKGYVTTGHNGSNYKKDFWEYDPVINLWTQKTDFGGDARLGGFGFGIDNVAYVGSGHDLNDIDRNDLWAFTFTQNDPTILSITPTSECVGNYITITGTNFINVASVSIGGLQVPSFNVISTSEIRAIVGSGINGMVSVSTASGTANYTGFTTLTPLITLSFVPDTIILNSPSSVILNPIVTGTPTSLEWFPSSKLANPLSLTPKTVIIEDSGSYILSITDQQGCKILGKITILINQEIFMPKAFTPNGDGLNDIFRIPYGILLELKDFSIYDRWGNKIFSTKNISHGWDGKYKNVLVENGIYIYVLSGRKDNKEIIQKGSFILIR